MRRILVAVTCCMATNLAGGCHSEAPTVCPGSETTEPLVCDRPVSVIKPPGYREDQRYPLLIALHGYASTVEGFDRLLGLRQAAAGATSCLRLLRDARREQSALLECDRWLLQPVWGDCR